MTNAGEETVSGTLFFWDDAGQPQAFSVDGMSRSQVQFNLPPAGALSLGFTAAGDLLTGYATVETDDPDSPLSGLILFELAGSEVSVPAVRGNTQGHAFVDVREGQLNSGLSFANPSQEHSVRLFLALHESDGSLRTQSTLLLQPGHKVAQFVGELFDGVEADFEGSIHITSAESFAMTGLRQRSDGSLSTLNTSDTAVPIGASQFVFLLDAGIDLTGQGFSQEELENNSVNELTGATEAANKQLIRLSNPHPDRAVTVSFRYFDAQCRGKILHFLVLLNCGETITIDPFDFEIPGANINVSDVLLGTPEPLELGPLLTGDRFGSGRLMLSISAVGRSTDGDASPEFLFGNEFGQEGVCNMSADNIGMSQGLSDNNLSVSNDRILRYNFLEAVLTGDEDGSCTGNSARAVGTLREDSEFMRRLSYDPEIQIPYLITEMPESCPLLPALENLGRTDCSGASIGATLEVPLPGRAITLLDVFHSSK
ncbi:MAG TPA: hypothetical protein VLV83_15930 [Acidobacteriota bacterium]|nr:hypothetical protein [Acidobacteriota bacterium]